MSTQHTSPELRDNAGAVVHALVEAGLVEQSRAGDAERVVDATLSTRPAGVPAAPLRRRMSEIAGYVGAAFVVGAAVLFFANQWGDLTRTGQIAILGGIAVLLGGAAGAVVATGGGRAAMRDAAQDVRRRLASVLSVGAAGAAGFAVGLAAQSPDRWQDDTRGVLVGAGVAFAVLLAGYRVAPSVVGQLGMAVAVFVALTSGLDVIGIQDNVTLFGPVVLLIGLAWLALAETGVWREDMWGRVIGVGIALVGAQIPVFDDPVWVGYGLTALVSAAAFTTYVLRPSWPYLALGVVAATLAVPEALSDWAGGSLGAAGGLLVAGVTLLVASLAGLRLRQEVSDEPRPPHHWFSLPRHT